MPVGRELQLLRGQEVARYAVWIGKWRRAGTEPWQGSPTPGHNPRMKQTRVIAPQISGSDKPKGPASYFPSIEEKYGQPMQHWIDLTVQLLESGATHMEGVSRLKQDHHLGHGHANAIVAYVKAKLAESNP